MEDVEVLRLWIETIQRRWITWDEAREQAVSSAASR
jgi:hypothetical protein